ncbi:MAG: hypothetical protein IH968_05650 [Gemmatimonadetes bacterium]|nr:hypothetical protein [Gemmatimonadota bacterium]
MGSTASDPGVVVATALTMMLVAVAGEAIPARRASRIDPVRAMRSGG